MFFGLSHIAIPQSERVWPDRDCRRHAGASCRSCFTLVPWRSPAWNVAHARSLNSVFGSRLPVLFVLFGRSQPVLFPLHGTGRAECLTIDDHFPPELKRW